MKSSHAISLHLALWVLSLPLASAGEIFHGHVKPHLGEETVYKLSFYRYDEMREECSFWAWEGFGDMFESRKFEKAVLKTGEKYGFEKLPLELAINSCKDFVANYELAVR